MANPITDWFQSLLGKGSKNKQLVKEVESQMASESTPAVPPPETEDSVAKDIKAVKSFVGKTVTTISKKVEPVATGATTQASQKISKAASSVNKPLLGKLLKALFIVLLIIILVFTLIKLFKSVGDQGNGDNEPGTNSQITPTPIVYRPYRPSVYAEDPEIAALELEITVLENELFRSSIREDRLFPPRLDFDIDFK